MSGGTGLDRGWRAACSRTEQALVHRAARLHGLRRLRRAARLVIASVRRRGLILLYHRVAVVPTDPWTLCVRPRHFAEQLEVLRERCRPMSFEDADAALARGELPPKAVVVTFDDGYADNLHNAKPLLERYGIPATFFLATEYIGQDREFWWDELQRLLLQPDTLPNTLRLCVGGNLYAWNLGHVAQCGEDSGEGQRGWRAWEDPPSVRHAAYHAIWQLLHRMPADRRRAVLEELAVWAGAQPHGRPGHRALSLNEVSTLAHGGLVEIGAHGVSHSALSALPIARQWDEVARSKARLEEVIGRPVTSFAYPFGRRRDYTAETVVLVRAAGYTRACSNFVGTIGRQTDRFQLPRLHVEDWDGNQFAAQLSEWFGV